MDNNVASVVLGALVCMSLFGVTACLLVYLAGRRRSDATNVTLGANAQYNAPQAGDHARIDIGAYTHVQACEDALGDMARVVDNLELVQKLLPAVRQGAYRGDITEMFEDISGAALEHLRRATFTVAMYRDGKYAYNTSVAAREAAYRAQCNGSGRAA